MAPLDLLPGLGQARQLVVAADQRGQPAFPCDLEPADGAGRPQNAMHGDEPGHALELLRAQGLGHEVALHQIPGRVADHHRLGRGDRLQASGDVGSLAHDRHPLPRLAHAHLAGDHHPGVDADPHPQRDAVLVTQPDVELLQFVQHREAGVYRALGAVLARLRVAEVDEDAVAGITGGVAVEAIGGARTRLLVAGEDLPEVLGIERLGQRRGADDVAEHHRHMAAVSRAGFVSGSRVRILQGAAATAAEPHPVRVLLAAVSADHPARDPTSSWNSRPQDMRKRLTKTGAGPRARPRRAGREAVRRASSVRRRVWP